MSALASGLLAAAAILIGAVIAAAVRRAILPAWRGYAIAPSAVGRLAAGLRDRWDAARGINPVWGPDDGLTMRGALRADLYQRSDALDAARRAAGERP